MPGTKTCSVGIKAEKQFGESFFWVLAGIPVPGSGLPFRYYVIPCVDMAANVSSYHRQWLLELGKKGQKRNDNTVRAVAVASGAASYFWNVAAFEDKWHLIEQILDD